MELYDPMYDFMTNDTCYSSAIKKHVRVLLSELCEREGVMPLFPLYLLKETSTNPSMVNLYSCNLKHYVEAVEFPACS